MKATQQACILVALGAFSIGGGAALATSLPDNTQVNLTSTLLSDHPEFSGETIYTSDVGYYTIIQGHFAKELPHTEAGVFHTQVIRETVSGTLDYYYYATPTVGIGVEHISLAGIPSSEGLDAYLIQPSAGPTYSGFESRQTYSPNTFSTVFGNPGVLFRTQETVFGGVQSGNVQLLFEVDDPGTQGAISVVVPGGPVGGGPVPEPMTIALLPLSVGMLGWRISRRRVV